MRLPLKAAVLVLLVCLSISVAGESARSLFNKGRAAETRQDYEGAYVFYQEAYSQKPSDLRFRASFERTRFLAAASKIHRGQILGDAGKFAEALALFEEASRIDPSSDMALQEIRRVRRILEAAGAGPASALGPAGMPVNSTTRRAEEAEGPVELSAISDQPITLRIAEDAKVIYQTIGQLAGVNVLFDPDYTSRRIPLQLNSVTLQEALDIVALESKTFWRPVTPNTIFVAADTPSKRKELEQSVVKTFYLGNLSATTDLQDIANALRTVLDAPKIQQVPSQGAIVIRATPDQVALAEKMIGDLDKSKPEVIVDVAVLQVRRDRMRTLGISPPTSVSAGIVPFTSTTTTGTTGTTSTTTSSSGNLTFNILKALTDRDISVTIPQASANFLSSDADTRLLQNPQIRASDGIKASLKIGDRIPIATGSFGGVPGAGLPGAGFGVQTQFQFIDVGVNMDITPYVHANREITLKISLEVSSQSGTASIGGISQPIISQRKAEGEVRLKEGEVNILGGIFETNDSTTISGIPGLIKIPFLKHLFGSQLKSKTDDEIVFVLTPHIVRGHEITELNNRAIDVGTSNAIDLRHGPARLAPAATITSQAPSPGMAVTGTPAAPATAAMVPAQVVPGPGVMVSPAPQTSPFASAGPPPPPGGVALSFQPSTLSAAVGTTFSVAINVAGGRDLGGIPVQITFDPKVLQLLNISNGDLLSRDGQAVALVHREEPPGMLLANATRPPNVAGIQGDGTVFVLTMLARGKGDSQILISRPGARNSAMQPMPAVASAMSVSVR